MALVSYIGCLFNKPFIKVVLEYVIKPVIGSQNNEYYWAREQFVWNDNSLHLPSVFFIPARLT